MTSTASSDANYYCTQPNLIFTSTGTDYNSDNRWQLSDPYISRLQLYLWFRIYVSGWQLSNTSGCRPNL